MLFLYFTLLYGISALLNEVVLVVGVTGSMPSLSIMFRPNLIL